MGMLLILGTSAAVSFGADTVTIDGKTYPLKKIDEAEDFASARKFETVKNGMKVTPEGVPFAWDAPRSHVLQEEYTAIRFPVDKVFAGSKAATKGGKCLTCHQGIEAISDTHDFACVECHRGNDGTDKMDAAHSGMVANPSDLTVVADACGRCHEGHMGKVQSSLMATAAGEINATRFAWGAQDSVDAVYGVNSTGGLKTIPTYAESGELVDDFLRKKCLRCHINSPAPQRLGEYRATGCAACHVIYSNDGKTMTGDKAIQKTQADNIAAKGKEKKLKADISGIVGKRGYPVKHRFTTAIPTVQCVRCHSGNRVGTEYIGLFEHDYEKMYRSPRNAGNAPLAPYGIDQHTLTPDIHYEKGLACIDCHNQNEMMGSGKIQAASHEALEVACQDCHGTMEGAPQTAKVKSGDAAIKIAAVNPNYSVKAGDEVAITAAGTMLGNVKKTAKGMVLTSKVTGKQHVIPQLRGIGQQPVSHQVSGHMTNMDCAACHSKWAAQDFGTHLMREDYANYKKWKRWREPDPQTLKLLYEALGSTVGDKMVTPDRKYGGLDADKWPKPETMDWLSGDFSTGVWFSSLTMRNWEDLILGRNSDGKYSMFRPQYQYFVSHIGPDMGKLRKEQMGLKKAIANAVGNEQRKLKMQELQLKREIDKQLMLNNTLVNTKDGRPGLVMNAYSPHTIGSKGRRCEVCHTNGEAAGLGRSTFYAARDTWVPQLDSKRAGLPIDFQIKQVVTRDGKPLQITTQKGARFLNKSEIDSLLGKSKYYRALRFKDLEQQNYLTLLDRKEKELTGGAKRMVKKAVSNGDVRKVGSYYDWKRYGFWQTDPVVFDDAYFKGKKTKTDISNDPVILEEKKVIEAGSKTYIKPDTANLNWVPKKN